MAAEADQSDAIARARLELYEVRFDEAYIFSQLEPSRKQENASMKQDRGRLRGCAGYRQKALLQRAMFR